MNEAKNERLRPASKSSAGEKWEPMTNMREHFSDFTKAKPAGAVFHCYFNSTATNTCFSDSGEFPWSRACCFVSPGGVSLPHCHRCVVMRFLCGLSCMHLSCWQFFFFECRWQGWTTFRAFTKPFTLKNSPMLLKLLIKWVFYIFFIAKFGWSVNAFM